jgi:hypothetical protein
MKQGFYSVSWWFGWWFDVRYSAMVVVCSNISDGSVRTTLTTWFSLDTEYRNNFLFMSLFLSDYASTFEHTFQYLQNS